MLKVYMNAIFLLIAATVASLSFSVIGGAVPELGKPAFIFGTTLAGGALSVGMVFASRRGRAIWNFGSPLLTPLDINVAAAVVSAFVILGGLVSALDVAIALETVIEGIAGGVAGSTVGIIMAFAKKDEGPEEEEEEEEEETGALSA